jgi:SAM-dependent methyltransferase
VSILHSNAPVSIAGFAGLQSAENRLVPSALGGSDADWVLEIAPVSGPSPALDRPRTRLMFDSRNFCWPLRASLDEWPLDDESVPAMLLRHVWQPAVKADPMDEVMRVLKPGGMLVSVSANPWHRLAWRELGKRSLMLPSWPHLQLLHARHGLSLSMPAASHWRGMVPGLTPVLVLVARKPSRPARVQPLRFKQPKMVGSSMPATQCRAA